MVPENTKAAHRPDGDGGGLRDQDQLGEQIEISNTAIKNDSQGARRHHQLATIFPPMTPDEFAALKDSIGRNGQREPVILLDGEVLDGVHRERACIELGVAPLYSPFRGTDPVAFVLDKNFNRRHLTTSQKGMVAADLGKLGWGGDRSKSSFEEGGVRREARAAALNVSYATVERADIVAEHGVAELQQAVRGGVAAVTTAAEIALLPADKQREILTGVASTPGGRRALKAVAKQVRADDQKARHVERQQKLESISAKNPDYPAGRLFSFALIDVPRHHDVYQDETGSEKAPENHYPTMTFDELVAFPIDRFLAPDAIIAYWSTAASLVDDIEILSQWGFVSLRPRDADGKLMVDPESRMLHNPGRGRYGSYQIWRKQRVGRQTGMGRWFRDQHEMLIVARRGNAPAPLPGTQDESVFDAPIGDHSEKPHGHVRTWINRCWPDLTKVEIFARGEAPDGWVFWGNQASDKGHTGVSASMDTATVLSKVVKVSELVKSGYNISVKHLPALADAFAQARDEAKSRGLLGGEDGG